MHRDIKPENLLVAGEQAFVVDFGVATSMHDVVVPEPLAGDLVADVALSRTLAGTPRYAAPEVLAGQAATPSSDLYSLALCLYEACAGGLPGDGLDTYGALCEFREQPVSTKALRKSGLPSRIISALERALSPAPAARFPDGHSFRKALAPRSRRWFSIVVLGVICAAVVGGLMWSKWRTSNGAASCFASAEEFASGWDAARRNEIAGRIADREHLSKQWHFVANHVDTLQRDGVAFYRDSCDKKFVGDTIADSEYFATTSCLSNIELAIEEYLGFVAATPASALTAGTLTTIFHVAISQCAEPSLQARFSRANTVEQRERLARYLQVQGRVTQAIQRDDVEAAKTLREDFARTEPMSAHLALIDILLRRENHQERVKIARSITDSQDPEIDLYTLAQAWGHLSSGLLYSEKSLAAKVAADNWAKAIAEIGNPAELRAGLYEIRGMLEMVRGNPDGARNFFAEWLAATKEVCDPHLILGASLALIALDNILARFDKVAERVAAIEPDVLRWFGRYSGEFASLVEDKMQVAFVRGDAQAGLSYARQLVEIRRAGVGGDIGMFDGLCKYGKALLNAGRVRDATAVFAEAVSIEVERSRRMPCERDYAAALIHLHQVDRARVLLESHLPLIRSTPVHESSMVLLANLQASLAHHKEAKLLFREAIERARRRNALTIARVYSQSYGAYLVDRNNYNEAREVLTGVVEFAVPGESLYQSGALAAFAVRKKRDGAVTAANDLAARASALAKTGCKASTKVVCARIARLVGRATR